MKIVNSLMLLQPGMYILRHPRNNPATLTVARAAANASATGSLQVMGTPGTDNCTLRDGADCLVMQITGTAVELLVTAYLPHADAPVPALRLDQIALDPHRSPAPAARPAAAGPDTAPAIVIPPAGVSIIGHIERTGDQTATGGATLGNPERQFRLEGFQVMWPDKPDGVDLAYSVAIDGASTLPIVKSGNFCGTRGQARRITEVTLALIGPRAPAYALQGTAWFSGGFQAPVQSGLPLGGPSGLEHLTALRLCVVPAPAQAANPWDASPRTKVFKQGRLQVDSGPAVPAAPPAKAAATPAARGAKAPAPAARPAGAAAGKPALAAAKAAAPAKKTAGAARKAASPASRAGKKS